MSIRHLLWGALLLVAALVGILGSILAVGQMQRIAHVATAESRLAALQGLAGVVQNLSPERGATTLAAAIVAPGDAAGLKSLADFRNTTDAALAKAKTQIAGMASSVDDGAGLNTKMAEIETLLVRARQYGDDVLAKPLDHREGGIDAIIDRNFAVNSAIAALLGDQLQRLSALDGTVYRYADLANAAWELRDIGGRQAGYLQDFIGARKPLTDEQKATYLQYQGQVDQIWAQLAVVRDLANTPSALRRELDNVRQGYIEGFGAEKLALMKDFSTGEFPYDASTFRDKTAAIWPLINTLRDTAYGEAASAAKTAYDQALLGVIVSATGMLAALIIVVIVLILINRRVIRPLTELTDNIGRIATGARDLVVPYRDRTDEMGKLAGAIGILQENSAEADRLTAAQEAARRTTERRAATLETLTRGFETKVGNLVAALSSSATEMEATAQSMSATAEQTNQQSMTVASAAEQASANVQTVAVAAEELTASIQEIGRQVEQSAKIADNAVEEATRTDAVVQSLAVGAQEIGDVIKIIQDIAGQTNLLALNATIEAARAGEAGKGFAVVASEVKALAKQTGRATGEIADQIGQIQQATQRAVEAIRGIGATIGEVRQIAAIIAAAVEEQSTATQEIARNVQQAAQGTQEVTSNIAGVKEAATTTGAAAAQVLGAAGDLSQQSNELATEVDQFLAGVKAA